MKDLKKIIKELPKEEPKGISGKIVGQIIRREIARLRQKRYSRAVFFILLILFVLGIYKAWESAAVLGTADFWQLVRVDLAFLDWESFSEGNPFIEGIFVLFISLLLIVPIWVIRHKDKIIGR